MRHAATLCLTALLAAAPGVGAPHKEFPTSDRRRVDELVVAAKGKGGGVLHQSLVGAYLDQNVNFSADQLEAGRELVLEEHELGRELLLKGRLNQEMAQRLQREECLLRKQEQERQEQGWDRQAQEQHFRELVAEHEEYMEKKKRRKRMQAAKRTADLWKASVSSKFDVLVHGKSVHIIEPNNIAQ